MPVCYRCLRMAATAELRRTTKKLKGGEQAFRCRDHPSCNARRRERRKAGATTT